MARKRKIRNVGGSSLGVAIHPETLKAAGFKDGDEITIEVEEKGTLLIKKLD